MDDINRSFYNNKEITEVIKYANSIVSYNNKPEDIVILTPYKMQAIELRKMLENTTIENINVSFSMLYSVN